ncbi:integrase [Bibersteinia trehalosi]|uniref:tyrosine-type recombinase/integrase n=1 Tax=Bibersteinia trehalosi TaxID=47735 RepID=UPI00104536D7|nr:tyrosine-type recombinase/integrase [Bibersteinia trehalosi]TCT13717.1 integrase [Bibersteinia trehalosi]
MAKFVKPLTETQLKTIKPKATPYSDGNNLYLFVRPAVRSFVYLYSHPITKKRIKKKIGEHPHLSLAQARDIARSYNQILAQGIDPFEYAEQQAKEQARQSITLAEFAAQWKRLKIATLENSESTMRKEWGRLNKHLFPYFGNKPLKDLAMLELVNHFLPLYEVKGDTVEKVIGRLVDMLNKAVSLGLLPHNHLQDLRKTFPRKPDTHNPTIKAEELPELFRCLSRANNFITAKLLVEWQMLTMLRPAEAVSVEWSEIDWENRLLHLPAEKMKCTLKKPRSHTVPLSTQALAVLDVMRQHNGHKRHVFAHRLQDDAPCNSQTANSVLKRNGYKGKLTAHGLRAMARTYLADQGIDFQIAETCLAHTVGNNTSQRYNHSDYLQMRREVMQMWGDFVEQCKKA